jgi:hypothetical protein
MNLIPIQGTSVPCERVFSASKETTTARRNRLSARVMEATQILKFQAKNKRGLSFTEGFDEAEELAELEEREEVTPMEDVWSLLEYMEAGQE